MLNITVKECQLAGKLLDMAHDEFSNHGCNDLPSDFLDGWSKEEIQNLYKEYHEWNGDPEDYDPNCTTYLGDYNLMAFLSDKLMNA